MAERISTSRAGLDGLIESLYGTVRSVAHRMLFNERPEHTLGTTGLAHEAYARLASLTRIEWRDRGHVLAAAAGAMRRVLVDHAVARRATKRGGGAPGVALSDAPSLVSDERLDEAVAVHQALERLEAEHPGAARVVECRVFGGLTIEETARALALSPATVKRQWTIARAWLIRALGHGGPPRV